ncbi:MAG: carbonic anhydrase [Patescibacteria group bacterium]
MSQEQFEKNEQSKSELKLLKKIEVSQEHYKADAATVTCIDDRFTDSVEAVKKEMGWDRVDSVKWAGGAAEIAKGSLEGKAALGQIEKSINLHDTKEIVLTMHEDCGACKGVMPEDHKGALGFMQEELEKAGMVVQKFLAEKGKSRPIRLLAYGLDGVYEVDLPQVQ